MNCRETRALIDAGVAPGSQSPQRVQLGFHLAQCAACRAHAAAAQQRLLEAMLSGAIISPAPVAPAMIILPSVPRPAPVAAPLRNPAHDRAMSPWSLLLIVGTLLAVALPLLAPKVQSALRIQENVQTMIVPTHAPTPPSTVAAAALSAPPTARSQPTALPTATATLAPTATLVPTPAPPAPGDAVTIALFGTDRRPGESGPARTDAIIVARIDPVSHRVALLSLPRDLYVSIPGYGAGRINAASAYGHADGSDGARAACAAVSALLGVPIDYFIMADFQGFIAAIDSLGGVTITAERDLHDARFPTMDYGYAEVYFPQGPQHLDGLAALTYSRIRHPDSDFARMKRQQAVLAAILGRLREQEPGATLTQLEATTTVLRGYVRTDIPEARMLGLAWALRELTPEAIERYSLDADMVSFGLGDDRWAELPLPGAIDGLITQLLHHEQ